MRPDRIVIGADDPSAIEAMRELYAPVPAQPRAPAGDGHPLGGAHQVRGQRDARHAHLLHERAGAPRRAPRRRHRARAPGHRLRSAHRLPLPLSRRRLRRLVLSQGRARRCCARPRRTASTSRWSARSRRPTSARRACWWRRSSRRFGENLAGRRIALWGLAFKPNTDDMREAPEPRGDRRAARARRHGHRLRSRGDAGGARTSTRPSRACISRTTPSTRRSGADALAIVTEWKEFRSPDFDELKRRLATPVIFDGRNLYEPAAVRAQGFEYFPIGRTVKPRHDALPRFRRLPRAGRRRRDARPLLVRRRRAHLARGAGAGGAGAQRSRSARAARPTWRATSPRSAARRRCSRWSATTRPARSLRGARWARAACAPRCTATRRSRPRSSCA